MSLFNDILAWRANGRTNASKAQPSELSELQARARGHIDAIYPYADQATKALLQKLDTFVSLPNLAEPGEAEAIADQINAWCQNQAPMLTGQALAAKIRDIFTMPEPPKAA